MIFPRSGWRTSVLLGWCAFALLGSSCSVKPPEDSQVVIRIPSVETLNGSSKVSASSYAWSKACFMITVRGEGIPMDPPGNVCALPGGLFAGSAAPGSTLTLRIPRGVSRELDVYVHFRDSATTACPVARNLNSFDPGSTVRVAQTTFAAQADEVNVSVDVSLPSSSTNLITQYSLPASCSAAAIVPGPGSSTIVAGRGLQTGGNFKVQSVVSGRQSEKVLTGGSFRMKVTRRPGEE